MAKMDLRVRLLGKVLSLAPSVTGMTDEQLTARQRTILPRNRIVDYLLGSRAHGIITSDLTAAGADGRIGIRVYRPMRAAEPLPLIVNIHGGGWISGNLDLGDWVWGGSPRRWGPSWCRWTTGSPPPTGSRWRWRTATPRWSTSPAAPPSSEPIRGGSR